MTQKTIKIFRDEIYSKPRKKNYPTNKTDVYYIGFLWSLDILDLKDCGPENNRVYRFLLVVIDKFGNFLWTIPLKNEIAQIVKESFEKITINSKRKSKLIETDDGKEFVNRIISDL